jgi:hypothetical protein
MLLFEPGKKPILSGKLTTNKSTDKCAKTKKQTQIPL